MQQSLMGKNIIVGITGGIAAYKSAELVRRLKEAGANVRVVMTAAATAFITPLTLQALSGQPVATQLLDEQAEAAMSHIALARFADAILIAPASADFIAKLTYGHADDLLTTLCLATAAPILVAPAMNQQMWQADITQQNVQALQARGINLIAPAVGEQACGDYGPGRLAETAELLAAVAHAVSTAEQSMPLQALAGKRVLITAGPTQEPLDPVRYLTNHSSGKMGYALAQAAALMGATVVLVSGPVALAVPPVANIQKIAVTTALAMRAAVFAHLPACDIFIAAAAVADYRCATVQPQKIAKTSETLTLQLVRNPDILAEVAALSPRPFIVGFAAQTHDIIAQAREKLHNKRLDMIIANQVGQAHTGFMSDTNEVIALWPKGEQTLPLAPKRQLAIQLMELIAEHYEKHRT